LDFLWASPPCPGFFEENRTKRIRKPAKVGRSPSLQNLATAERWLRIGSINSGYAEKDPVALLDC
jgi:hypothetical protein